MFFRDNSEKLRRAVEDVMQDYFLQAKNELAELRNAKDLSDKVKTLTAQVSKLEITKSQIEETHAREKREIEHKLGLEKTRQKQELEIGLREQSVKIKEENLTADKKRFEDQMKFMSDRMTKETDYLKDMMQKVLDSLPTVNHTIKENR